MLIDFRASESPQLLDCDLCIVGAGLSGSLLAREFAASGLQVVLLESQDLSGEPPRTHKHPGQAPDWALQGQWSAPMAADDFVAKPWASVDGWPFGSEQLDSYYPRGSLACGIDPGMLEGAGSNTLPFMRRAFEPSRVSVTRLLPCPEYSFDRTSRELLAKSGNVRVLYCAQVLTLDTNETGELIKGVTFTTQTGRLGRVRPRHLVLAAGGIETPRILLNSNRRQANGIGNRYGQVGRNLMHRLFATAALAFVRSNEFPSAAYATPNHAQATTGLRSSFELQRRNQVLPAMICPTGEPSLEVTFNLGKHGLPDTPPGYLARPFNASAEQWPDQANGVTLASQPDRHGLPQARVEWRANELDKQSMRVLATAVGAELIRMRLGRLKLADWLVEPGAFDGIDNDATAMGTTRLGTDPRSSVVNPDCQVHGMGNLHIAGPSVLRTASCVNPSLTVAAMTLRLAERLRQIV